MCCVTSLVTAETPSPPAPTAKAKAHSQKFCRTVTNTVAKGVDTMMICSVTVIAMTYIKALLLVMPVNTLSALSPSFLELISLKTCRKTVSLALGHPPYTATSLAQHELIAMCDESRVQPVP